MLAGSGESFEALYGFLSDEFPGKRFDDTSPDWRLEEDLGLYGDDADEFIARFSERFGIDISRFDIADHFRPEGEFVFYWLYHLFFKKRTRLSPSITDLKTALRIGKLVPVPLIR